MLLRSPCWYFWYSLRESSISISKPRTWKPKRPGLKGNIMHSILFEIATVTTLVVLMLAPRIIDLYFRAKDLEA